MNKFKDVDSYIESYPRDIQIKLKKIRVIIKKFAPKAEEKISYGMIGYKLNGVLVYFGAFKNHISFFPTIAGMMVFKKELLKYASSKGTIQFPNAKPIPYGLIAKITKYRVKQNLPNIRN